MGYTKILNDWGESNESMCKKIDANGGWQSGATDLMFYHTGPTAGRPTVWANDWTITKEDGTTRLLNPDWWSSAISLKEYKEYKQKEWMKAHSATVKVVEEAVGLLYDSVKKSREYDPENPCYNLEEASRIANKAVEKLKTAAVMSTCKATQNV